MRSPRRTRHRFAAALLGGATVIGVAMAAGPAVASAPQGRHPIGGSAPRWLRLAHKIGATPPGLRIEFSVLLAMRDQAAAIATLEAISEPTSRSYGRWLRNSEFRSRFAPAGSSVAAVQDWLRSRGFTVTATLPSGMLVSAAGSVAQVEQTFATRVNSYRYLGATVRANATPLSLPAGTPAAVADTIAGVLGIDQGTALKRPAGTALKRPASTAPGPAPGARYGVQPCSAFYGQQAATAQPSAYGSAEPYVICGYGPEQYQAAYGETSLLRHGVDGRGVTVAITGAYASPTIYGDSQQYSREHQQPGFTSGQFTQATPGANGYRMASECGAQGWYGEETLAVEAVHAMAPGARIVYVGAPDCSTGLDDAWASAIDHHIADVITNSWTDGTGDVSLLGSDYVRFYQQFSLEAALTGITVNFSSGDSGDQTAGGRFLARKAVEFPADLPYVTGVGGTSVLIGRHGTWLGEYGWQSAYSSLVNGAWNPAAPGTYSAGGGGGTSRLFGQPFYQVGKVPTLISEYYGSTPMRAVPDISMPGDPNTGFEVGQTQVFGRTARWDQYRVGGTSLSSPLLSGVVAVADQFTGHPLGFVNPLYYHLLGTRALHDIVAPASPLAEVRTDYVNFLDDSQGRFFRLRTIDVQTSTLHATPGYDDETGVGSPDGPRFFLRARIGGHRRP